MPVQSNVFTFRMPAGIPGRVNREQEHTGVPEIMDVANPPLSYGDPVKMGSNGKIQALAPGDTAASVYGFLESPYPIAQTQGGLFNQGYGPVTPAPGGRCTVMRRGYMTVVVYGQPSSGGTVYVRLAGTPASRADGTAGRVGGLEASNDATAGNTIALPVSTSFRGAPDGAGNTEIAFNI